RYAYVANWLELGPLVEVQKNLRALRSQIKTASEDPTSLRKINALAAKETDNTVVEWDAAKIAAYANTHVLAPLDGTLLINTLEVSDDGYAELAARAKLEEDQIGLAALRSIRRAAAALWEQV